MFGSWAGSLREGVLKRDEKSLPADYWNLLLPGGPQRPHFRRFLVSGKNIRISLVIDGMGPIAFLQPFFLLYGTCI